MSSPILQASLRDGLAVFVTDLRLPGAATLEPADVVANEMGAAIAALREDRWVDAERAVFYGHSFGGYVALTLLARAPSRGFHRRMIMLGRG